MAKRKRKMLPNQLFARFNPSASLVKNSHVTVSRAITFLVVRFLLSSSEILIFCNTFLYIVFFFIFISQKYIFEFSTGGEEGDDDKYLRL